MAEVGNAWSHECVVPADRRQAPCAAHVRRRAVAIAALAAGCACAAVLAAQDRGGTLAPRASVLDQAQPRPRDIARSCGRHGNAACPAEQTSTAAGGGASQALGAGPHSADSCTKTEAQSDPWWRVDFGRVVKVHGLRLFGASMCDALGVGVMPGSSSQPVNMNVGVPCGCGSASVVPAAAPAPAPAYSAQGGPQGAGCLVFNRELNQFVAAGTRSLQLASKGGLTAVAVVRFGGAAVSWERIFDFGNGANQDNVLLARKGSGEDLVFLGYNGASRVCNVEAAGVLKQNQWLTIVVRYDAAEGSVRLLVNGIEAASASCSEPLADRSVANTLVGKSNWPGDPSFNGDMAGVLVSDRSLSGDEIQWAAAAIGLGHDPVCGYRSERLHGWQVRVGNNGWAPNKNPPCVHAASEPMTPIALNAPGGEFREVNCTSAVRGKYLFIQLSGPNRVLSICNLQVWGAEYDPWVEGGSNEEKWLSGPEPAWHTNGCVPGAPWCTRVGENTYFIPP